MSTFVRIEPVETQAQNDIAGILTRLEIAAEAQDEAAFLTAYRVIDWSKAPPEAVARTVRLSLLVGLHDLARKLAMQGAADHPAHVELQKMARILAPPQIKSKKGAPDSGIRANRDWLRDYADQYRGRWIALRNGELLAVADTPQKLMNTVGPLKNSKILVTKVY